MTESDHPDSARVAPPEPTGPRVSPTTDSLPPLAQVIARPQKQTSRSTTILFALAGAIAIGGLAFAGGRLTAPVAAATTRGNGQFPGANGQFPGGNGAAGGNGNFRGAFGAGGVGIEGTVTAIDASSVTIKLANGTTLTIPIAATTTYHTAAVASAADVTVGSSVRVTAGRADGAGGPAASGRPAASGGPGVFRLGTATDITVTGK